MRRWRPLRMSGSTLEARGFTSSGASPRCRRARSGSGHGSLARERSVRIGTSGLPPLRGRRRPAAEHRARAAARQQGPALGRHPGRRRVLRRPELEPRRPARRRALEFRPRHRRDERWRPLVRQPGWRALPPARRRLDDLRARRQRAAGRPGQRAPRERARGRRLRPLDRHARGRRGALRRDQLDRLFDRRRAAVVAGVGSPARRQGRRPQALDRDWRRSGDTPPFRWRDRDSRGRADELGERPPRNRGALRRDGDPRRLVRPGPLDLRRRRLAPPRARGRNAESLRHRPRAEPFARSRRCSGSPPTAVASRVRAAGGSSGRPRRDALVARCLQGLRDHVRTRGASGLARHPQQRRDPDGRRLLARLPAVSGDAQRAGQRPAPARRRERRELALAGHRRLRRRGPARRGLASGSTPHPERSATTP